MRLENKMDKDREQDVERTFQIALDAGLVERTTIAGNDVLGITEDGYYVARLLAGLVVALSIDGQTAGQIAASFN